MVIPNSVLGKGEVQESYTNLSYGSQLCEVICITEMTLLLFYEASFAVLLVTHCVESGTRLA